jgi:hypothetical protein
MSLKDILSVNFNQSEVIADLASKVFVFENLYLDEKKGNEELLLKVQELEKHLQEERARSVSFADIAKIAENCFKTETIPLPNLNLAKSKGMVSVSCRPEDVSFVRNNIEAYVSFSCANSGTGGLSFRFVLIPNTRNNESDLYPYFHMGFNKPPKPKKKPAKKAPLKIVDAKTTTALAADSPVTSNPS